MAATHARWQPVQVMPVFLGKDAGVRIALASSAKENGLEACERVADIPNSMHEHTSSSDAEKSRLRLSIFSAILMWLDYPWPGVMVVVSHMPYDAEAGGKVGLPTVGVLCGSFSGQSVYGVGCVAIHCGPADLPAYLDQPPLAWELAS